QSPPRVTQTQRPRPSRGPLTSLLRRSRLPPVNRYFGPPNGKLVSETISGVITDVLSGVNFGTATFRLLDEYGQIQPTGPISMESSGRYSFTLSVEAQRQGQDPDGRHYEVIVSAADKAGNA